MSEDFDDAGRNQFFSDLRSDIRLFEKVKKEVEALNLVEDDPKARQLIAEIRLVLNRKHPELVNLPSEPQRKVLVFTEFADTVDHLQGYLDREFPNQVLTIRSLSKELTPGCSGQEPGLGGNPEGGGTAPATAAFFLQVLHRQHTRVCALSLE